MSEIDRRTRKLLAFHKAHNPKDDAHRLYIKKKKKKKGGRRGLISIEE